MTIRTLKRCAQLVCDSPDSLTDKIKYLDNVFNKNNNNWDLLLIRHNTYRNSEPNTTNTNATPVTSATIPYIKGTSETIARILQPYNIRVTHKPITTLRQLLTNIKDNLDINQVTDREQFIRSNAATARPRIIGDTGRNLNI